MQSLSTAWVYGSFRAGGRKLLHATVGITLDTYSHVPPNLQEEAARKIDALLARGASGRRRDP